MKSSAARMKVPSPSRVSILLPNREHHFSAVPERTSDALFLRILDPGDGE